MDAEGCYRQRHHTILVGQRNYMRRLNRDRAASRDFESDPAQPELRSSGNCESSTSATPPSDMSGFSAGGQLCDAHSTIIGIWELLAAIQACNRSDGSIDLVCHNRAMQQASVTDRNGNNGSDTETKIASAAPQRTVRERRSWAKIGHNVRLDRYGVVVAEVGIGGSTILEDFVQVGGQAPMAGDFRLAKAARSAHRPGSSPTSLSGRFLLGSHAQPRKKFFRQIAHG